MATVYSIITIDRAHNVVRTADVCGWVKALDELANRMYFAQNSGWTVYPSGTWSCNANRKLRGRVFTTSFGMTNGKKVEGGDYYFTYIKCA